MLAQEFGEYVAIGFVHVPSFTGAPKTVSAQTASLLKKLGPRTRALLRAFDCDHTYARIVKGKVKAAAILRKEADSAPMQQIALKANKQSYHDIRNFLIKRVKKLTRGTTKLHDEL